MTLIKLGYKDFFETFKEESLSSSLELGRVISEHRSIFVVKSEEQEWQCELIGHLRFTAESKSDLPAVGDWVAFSEYDEGKALIHNVGPRFSQLERSAVGKKGEAQIIATNIDSALIIQAVDRDFNINRLERYLTICNASKVTPIIILSKIDLVSESDLDLILDQVNNRIKDVPLFCVSNKTKGYDEVNSYLKKGETYCLLGSSGVGKSTLLNHISGKILMETKEISSSLQKGRHTTSHRELFILDNGSIMIDNPGMREIGIADASFGLETTFESILERAANCKFKDCQHINENDCAVLDALDSGILDQASYDNYLKMEREKAHYEASALEKKQKDKEFGKMVKGVLKQHRKNKF